MSRSKKQAEESIQSARPPGPDHITPIPLSSTQEIASSADQMLRANRRERTNLWLGIGGLILGVVGIVLAVYYYDAAKVQPRLTFAIHPLKTELQGLEIDKDLSFTYRGNHVDSTCVTSIQIAVWNDGNQAIQASDVLEPVRIALSDSTQILSAHVKNVTRLVCGFACITSEQEQQAGKCTLGWRILEPKDGAVIQLILAGTESRPPMLEGVIKGQPGGIQLSGAGVRVGPTNRSEEPLDARNAYLLGFLLLTLVCFAVTAVLERRSKAYARVIKAEKALEKERKRVSIKRNLLGWALIAVGITSAAAALALLLFAQSPGPPFEW